MIFWFLSLLACQPNPCESGPQPDLRVGTGELAFTPFGDTVELIHGPQGGYHIWIGLQGSFLAAQSFVGGDFSAFTDEGEVANSKPWLNFTCNAERNTQETWGSPLILTGDPSTVINKNVTIVVNVSDNEERLTAAEAQIYVVDTVDESPL